MDDNHSRCEEFLIDHQGKEAKYPKEVPRLFHSVPVEDYNEDVCAYLCQNQPNISWKSLFNYHFNTCKINDSVNDEVTKHELCSSNDCHTKTAFASIDYFVEYFRFDDANFSKTPLQNQNSFLSMDNQIKIWIKAESNFYTIKNINVEKKFQEFLAEIGGNFGLFAGASVLTLVEIGEFFVKIIKRIIIRERGSTMSATTQTEESGIPVSHEAP